MDTKIPSKLLKADELAERLRCSKSGIYKLAASGRIPHVRLGEAVGGAVRFDFEEVRDALHRAVVSK